MFTSALAIILATGGLSACVHSAIYTSRVEDAQPPRGQTVDVEGHSVHYIQAGPGDAQTVLFIHGASANANEFSWTLSPRLDERFNLIMADRPGHGYSARPEDGAQLGVQARQMAGLLRTVSDGSPVVVVGHSFGGAVALRLALDYPELVAGMVLLAPVSHDWGEGGQTWYNETAKTPVIGPAFSQLVPIVGPGQLEAGIASTFAPAPVPDNYIENSGVKLLFRPRNFRANANDVIALREELAAQQNRYTALDMPIIVFSGAQDTVIAPRLHVGRLKDQATKLELIKLPEGGHMPHHAHGDDVAAAITRLASAANAE